MLQQEGARTQGQGDIPSSPLEDGWKAPVITSLYGAERLKTTTADLKRKTSTKLYGTWTLSNWLPRISEVPSESLLEDVNEGLQNTATITKTNKLIYSTASVVLEALCSKINTSYKEKFLHGKEH